MRRDDLAHATPAAHPRDIIVCNLELLPMISRNSVAASAT